MDNLIQEFVHVLQNHVEMQKNFQEKRQQVMSATTDQLLKRSPYNSDWLNMGEKGCSNTRIKDEKLLISAIRTYFTDVSRRTPYNEKKVRKVNDNVEDFVKKWNNNPNVDNEILVREWLDEKMYPWIPNHLSEDCSDP